MVGLLVSIVIGVFVLKISKGKKKEPVSYWTFYKDCQFKNHWIKK